MKLGVCYYPEHWPETRWASDARMMRELGLDIARIAEFAWAKIEPAEGEFDFDWLDRAIDALSGAGLQVVLGTPTAAPPAWLSRTYPDTLPVDASGTRRNFGGRRHYCPNHPTYQALSKRVAARMLERYGKDSRIVGWQIDNEFGGGNTARCYCPECARAFRAWLLRKYGDLAALNEAWATVFWSQTYSDWQQITAPTLQFNQPNPSHALDYWRFSSDSIAAYQRQQVDLARALAPGQWATTNLMGLYPDLDHFDLAADLDFVTWDSYPTGNLDRWAAMLFGDEARGARAAAYDVGDPYVTGLAHDLTRGLLNRPFWIMEQQAGHINWGAHNPAPRPGTVRLWTWHALASGADACVYFRWRACLFAQEQYHSGLLNHDATPDIGYAEVQRLAGERDLMAELSVQPRAAEVALMFSYDDLWALQLQPHRRDFSYLRLLFVWYRALQRLGIGVDVIPARADQRAKTHQRALSSYKLVLAPTLHLGDAALAAELEAYAEGGGTLLMGIRSGFKTAANRVTDLPLPGVFRSLVGAAVVDWHALPPGVTYGLTSSIEGMGGQAEVWAEALLPAADATTLAAFTGGPLAGSAAVVARQTGDGTVLFCGLHPTPEQARAMTGYLAALSGAESLGELPDGLLAARRGGRVIVMNFTDARLEADVAGQRVSLAPRDARVV